MYKLTSLIPKFEGWYCLHCGCSFYYRDVTVCGAHCCTVCTAPSLDTENTSHVALSWRDFLDRAPWKVHMWPWRRASCHLMPSANFSVNPAALRSVWSWTCRGEDLSSLPASWELHKAITSNGRPLKSSLPKKLIFLSNKESFISERLSLKNINLFCHSWHVLTVVDAPQLVILTLWLTTISMTAQLCEETSCSFILSVFISKGAPDDRHSSKPCTFLFAGIHQMP